MKKMLLSVLATLMLLSCAAAGTTHAAPPSPLTITTSTLANGSVGSPYSQTLTASGGKKPYTWSITTGSLPAGLILNGGTGAINGTPATAGSNSFTVQVKDANNTTVTKSLSITVNGSGLTITTSILSDGYVGAAYSQTLAATGGYTPYSWSITTGTLPAGLGLMPEPGLSAESPQPPASVRLPYRLRTTIA